MPSGTSAASWYISRIWSGVKRAPLRDTGSAAAAGTWDSWVRSWVGGAGSGAGSTYGVATLVTSARASAWATMTVAKGGVCGAGSWQWMNLVRLDFSVLLSLAFRPT